MTNLHILPDQKYKNDLRKVVEELPADLSGYMLLSMDSKERSMTHGAGLGVGQKAFLLQLLQHLIQEEIRSSTTAISPPEAP